MMESEMNRIALIGFVTGAAVSFLAGMFTSGLAAGYAFVAMLSWNIVSRLASEALASNRLLIMTLTALVHGLLFAGIVILAGVAFPRLKENRIGGNLFLVSALAYGALLAFAFPVTP
jgi:hypothetical protein